MRDHELGKKKNPSVYNGWILSLGKPQELCLPLNKFSISLWQDHLVRISAMQLFISKIRILQMKLVINAECEYTIFCWKFLLLGHPSCIFLILLMFSSSYFSLNILTCKILLINIPIPYFFPFHNLCVLPSFQIINSLIGKVVPGPSLHPGGQQLTHRRHEVCCMNKITQPYTLEERYKINLKNINKLIQKQFQINY